MKDSYVEGDVDYVFGRANAVFDNVHFHTVSTRRSPEAYVLAPNTLPDNPYGFLVKNSRFTGDGGYQGSFKAKLGRAWDQGAGKTGYLAGKTANGQVLIANSTIDQSYDRLSPGALRPPPPGRSAATLPQNGSLMMLPSIACGNSITAGSPEA